MKCRSFFDAMLAWVLKLDTRGGGEQKRNWLSALLTYLRTLSCPFEWHLLPAMRVARPEELGTCYMEALCMHTYMNCHCHSQGSRARSSRGIQPFLPLLHVSHGTKWHLLAYLRCRFLFNEWPASFSTPWLNGARKKPVKKIIHRFIPFCNKGKEETYNNREMCLLCILTERKIHRSLWFLQHFGKNLLLFILLAPLS